MKQTNNAIKFLMAQYRAIFKNAYLKGMATALVLTAGLAATAGNAQAATQEFDVYTNSIVKGWKSGAGAPLQISGKDIAVTTNRFQVAVGESGLSTEQAAAIQEQLNAITSGSLIHISADKTLANKAVFTTGETEGQIQTDTFNAVNIIGKSNFTTDSGGNIVISGAPVTGELTIGKGGQLAMNIKRGKTKVDNGSGSTAQDPTGGAVFAGFAASYEVGADATTYASPASVSVINSRLTVADGYYADDAVIAGYAVHTKDGHASVTGNVLTYTSNNVKQAATSLYTADGGSNPAIPSTMLAGGYARTQGGSATASSNEIHLLGDRSNAKTNITEKNYFGGGYATYYGAGTDYSGSSTKEEQSVIASNNIAELSDLTYNAGTTGKELTIFGGIAYNQVGATYKDNNKVGTATAIANQLTLTDVDITTNQTDTSVEIYGGKASNSTLSKQTSGTATVNASQNSVVIDARDRDGAQINLASATGTGEKVIIGGFAEQREQTSANVDLVANNNSVTVQGNVKINGATIYGARTDSSVTATDKGATTTALNNTVSVTDGVVLTNTSLIAAAVDATDNNSGNGITHSGNTVIVDSNALSIADGKTVEIAGDILDVKGNVWVKSTGSSVVTFGGVKNENDNKYYNGTGTLTGTLYNQGTVNVHNELDITNGTIYALGENAKIVVDGSLSAETDAEGNAETPDPLTAGYATLKTSEQQIKDYLTSGSATNVSLPVEGENVDPTVISGSSAGIVAVKSGAAIDFGSTVTLSNFNFNNTETAGAINVSSGDGDSAYFKADTVNIAHVLASNATTEKDIDQLSGFDAKNVYIRANTLNLGSSTLTSAQSAKIDFAEARARDAINFDAMTTGDNTGYILTSDVVADRKFFDQQIVDKAEINTTTLNSNGNGTITGDVTIGTTGVSSASGNLSVAGGTWTSNSNIAVVNGGLSVGAVEANGPNPTTDKYVNNGNPASLTLTGTLNISGANATVSVSGAAGADATLDLTGADVKWNAGTVTVSGSPIDAYRFNTEEAQDYYADNSLDRGVGYGKLFLNREDFNEFLNDKVQTPAQTKLNIGDGGYVHVNGSVTGSYDFDKFGTTEAAGVVAFTGTHSGILDIDGELNLVEAAEDADNTFDIGHGTIKANIISINTEDKDRDENPEAITLAGGTLEVEQGFSTNSSEFTIAGDDEHNAALVLAAGLEHTGSLTMGGTSGLLTVGNNAKLTVQNGTWANDKIDLQVTSDNGQVIVGPYDDVLIKQAQDLSTEANTVYVASLQADNFAGEGSGTVLSVGEQSSATFNTMQLASDAVVNVDGYLKVEGRNDINDRNDPAYVNAVDGVSSTAGINFEQGATINVDGVGSTFELGEKATQALVTIDSTVTDATKNKYVVDEVLSDANIDVSNFGELKINLSADQTLTKADAAYLTTTLLGSNNYNGYLNVGAADLGISFTPDANGNNTVAWDDIEDFANITAGGTTSQDLKYALVTGIASANDRIQGHYGALQVTTGNTSALQVVGPLSLHNAADFGGKFVFRGDYLNGTTTAADIVFAQNASLALENGGEIGSITGYGSYDEDYGVNSVQISAENGATTTVNGSITKIDELVVDGDTTVTDSVAVNYLDLSASLNTTAENSSVHVNSADISENAVLKTNSFTIGNANGLRDSIRGNNVNVLGAITTGDLTLNENAELDLFGGVVTAKNLTASATSDISVGYDPLSTIVEDDPDTIYDDTKAYTGSLEITGQTKLNGAELYVDPEYGDHTALVSLNKLSGWTNASPRFEGGVLDGSVFVGRNSALGIGSDSLATLQSKIARFQNGVSLEDPQANPDGVGAVLYLGNSFTLGAGESLWLTAMTTEGVREYYNANNGTLADISSTANLNVLADTVYLGENTAIVVDAGVLENSSAMITLAGTNGTASVIADGGDIYIDGNVRASTYQVFSGAQIKYIDGSDYAVTEDSEKNINVSTINDFLQGVVDEQGKVTLGVAHNGRAIMHGASDPVYESLLAYVRGYNGPEVKQKATEETPVEQEVQEDPQTPPTNTVVDNGIQGVEDSRELYSYNDKGEKVYGQYSNYLLQETIATGDGSAAETVARLAVFGGAAQAAISAGASTYDAVSGRMGVGANGANITVADNTQGAALWLAPIYKSSDSDGFDAEGLDYGVDMDLYGVALGADYTLSNGIRFGAMFNVGSGDVDGQGAGSAVSNDFDYYGFAVYGGYSMGALSVVADVSYTVADNDLEGNTSIDKVGASLDSTNLSLGVTGQYQLDFNGTTVTPHAGLRFSRIDLDDYTVDGEDIIADYDADSMNIFSIPVGVTFAKEFTGDAWTVKPSLDLTLTGNFGDDETDGTVHWAGVENLSTNVSSEVIDNFTYGATLGVAAKTGNFSLGLGVNYTGSSNVDEFGVNANARFVF